MSSLVVVGFPTVNEAEEVRRALVDIQKEQLISLEDAVVVDRDAEGHVHLRQAINLTAAGAASGGFWGVLVGLLFANPLLGAAVGAGVGAASGALSDLGINDGFLRDVGESLTTGTAALCLLTRESTPDRVIERLRDHAPNARLLRTNLSHADENQLRQLLEKASQDAHGTSA
ncbi:MAG: DUF1269 domain-containing protein [Cyanobacteriota bacterium]|nr:DUF1269 domain-containing protein [Cyanobacteriota bacterium]